MPDTPSQTATTSQNQRWRFTPVKLLGAGLLVLFSVLIITLLIGIQIDLTDYRSSINQKLTDTLERSVNIKGEMALNLSFAPSFHFSDIQIADKEENWGPMVEAGIIEAKLSVLPLLTGTVNIHSARLENMHLNLSRDMDGNANWVFKEPSNQKDKKTSEQKSPQNGLLPFKLVLSDSISVKNIQLYYYDQSSGSAYDWSLETMNLDKKGEDWHLAARGYTLGYPYDLSINGGIENLINNKMAKLSLKGEFIGAQLSATVDVQPFSRGDSQLSVALDWNDASAVEHLLGLDVGPAAPVSLKTSLILGKGHLNIPELTISSPVAQATGWLKLAKGSPNTIDGQLTVPLIDFSPWIQATAQPAPRAIAYAAAPPAKSPLQMALDQWLVNTATHVDITLDEIKGLGTDINNISLSVSGKNGILLAPMTADIADVPFRGEAKIDGSGWASTVNIRLGAENAPLGSMASWLSGIDQATGHLQQAKLELKTEGTKLKEWISNSQLDFTMQDTRLEWGKKASWAIDQATFTAGMNRQTHVSVDGQLMGIPASLNMSGGSIMDALQKRHWPTDIAFSSPALTFSAKGELVAGQWQNGSWLNLDVASEDISKMSPWLGTLPDVQGQLKLSGKLSSDGQWVNFQITPMQLLDSKGQITARWRPEKDNMFIAVDGQLENLDLAQISDWVSSPSMDKDGLEQPVVQSVNNDPGLQLDLPLLSSEINIADADLQLGIDRLIWANQTIHKIKLEGQVRDGWLKQAPFSAHYASGHYQGDMQLDLRHPLIKARFNLSVTTPDIGQMMANFDVAEQLEMSLESASLDINLQGHTLLELMNQAEVKASLSGGHWQLADSYTGKQFTVSLTNGTFVTGPDTATHLTINGNAGQLPLTLTLDSVSLAATQDGRDHFPVTLDVKLGDMRFNAESSITLPLDRQQIKLAMHAFTPNLDRFNRFTGVDLPPYGPITLAGNFSMDELGYQLKDLLVKVNSSYLKGQGSILPGKEKQQKTAINIALEAPFIQIDDFAVENWQAWLPVTDEAPSEEEKKPAALTSEDKATAPFLSPESLKLFSAQFTLDVDEVRSGEDWLGAGSFHWQLSDGRLVVEPLTVQLPGGKIDLMGEVTAIDDKFDITLNGGADHFNYGILARRIKPETDMSGTVSIDVDVHSRSSTPDTLMENATGSFGFSVWPEQFEAGIIDLWAIGLVDAVLPTFNKENTSMLNCAAGVFKIDDGNMQQKKVLLDTSRIQVTGDVEADFNSKTLDLYLTPRSKKAEIFSLQTPIKVVGEFEDFSLNVPLSALLKTSVQFTTSPVISPVRWLFETPIERNGSQLCEDMMRGDF